MDTPDTHIPDQRRLLEYLRGRVMGMEPEYPRYIANDDISRDMGMNPLMVARIMQDMFGDVDGFRTRSGYLGYRAEQLRDAILAKFPPAEPQPLREV